MQRVRDIEQLKRVVLTSLAAPHQREQPLWFSTIMRQTGLDVPRLTAAVDTLIEEGYVEPWYSSPGMERIAVRITPKGLSDAAG
jgi:DNA-binding MarR family transcriptional regulator